MSNRRRMSQEMDRETEFLVNLMRNPPKLSESRSHKRRSPSPPRITSLTKEDLVNIVLALEPKFIRNFDILVDSTMSDIASLIRIILYDKKR